MHDVAAVADDLARQRLSHRAWEELGRLELLNDELRLGLGAGSRRVIALEGEEDNETDEDREARCEHAEDAGGAIAVLEVAPFGRTAPDEQHRADGQRGHDDDDQGREEQVHLGIVSRFGTHVAN